MENVAFARVALYQCGEPEHTRTSNHIPTLTKYYTTASTLEPFEEDFRGDLLLPFRCGDNISQLVRGLEARLSEYCVLHASPTTASTLNWSEAEVDAFSGSASRVRCGAAAPTTTVTEEQARHYCKQCTLVEDRRHAARARRLAERANRRNRRRKGKNNDPTVAAAVEKESEDEIAPTSVHTASRVPRIYVRSLHLMSSRQKGSEEETSFLPVGLRVKPTSGAVLHCYFFMKMVDLQGSMKQEAALRSAVSLTPHRTKTGRGGGARSQSPTPTVPPSQGRNNGTTTGDANHTIEKFTSGNEDEGEETGDDNDTTLQELLFDCANADIQVGAAPPAMLNLSVNDHVMRVGASLREDLMTAVVERLAERRRLCVSRLVDTASGACVLPCELVSTVAALLPSVQVETAAPPPSVLSNVEPNQKISEAALSSKQPYFSSVKQAAVPASSLRELPALVSHGHLYESLRSERHDGAVVVDATEQRMQWLPQQRVEYYYNVGSAIGAPVAEDVQTLISMSELTTEEGTAGGVNDGEATAEEDVGFNISSAIAISGEVDYSVGGGEAITFDLSSVDAEDDSASSFSCGGSSASALADVSSGFRGSSKDDDDDEEQERDVEEDEECEDDAIDDAEYLNQTSFGFNANQVFSRFPFDCIEDSTVSISEAQDIVARGTIEEELRARVHTEDAIPTQVSPTVLSRGGNQAADKKRENPQVEARGVAEGGVAKEYLPSSSSSSSLSSSSNTTTNETSDTSSPSSTSSDASEVEEEWSALTVLEQQSLKRSLSSSRDRMLGDSGGGGGIGDAGMETKRLRREILMGATPSTVVSPTRGSQQQRPLHQPPGLSPMHSIIAARAANLSACVTPARHGLRPPPPLPVSVSSVAAGLMSAPRRGSGDDSSATGCTPMTAPPTVARPLPEQYRQQQKQRHRSPIFLSPEEVPMSSTEAHGMAYSPSQISPLGVLYTPGTGSDITGGGIAISPIHLSSTDADRGGVYNSSSLQQDALEKIGGSVSPMGDAGREGYSVDGLQEETAMSPLMVTQQALPDYEMDLESHSSGSEESEEVSDEFVFTG